MICLISACTSSPNKENIDPYWKVDISFDAPSNWKTYNYANAFSISIPEYMRPTQTELIIDKDSLNNEEAKNPFGIAENKLNDEPLKPGEVKTMVFKPDRSLKEYDNYSRIYIEYHQGNNGDFLKRYDMPSLYDPDGILLCKQLIQQCLGTGVLLCVLERTWQPLNAGMVLDICYRRMGHSKDSGSTTVHIFVLKDFDKSIFMTISYSTKHKEAYKDLFNVVNTIKWTSPNIISQ